MRRGFTLVELLVVITIIGVLSTLTLSVAGGAKDVGNRAKCANSLRQLSTATALYLADHDQQFFAYSTSLPDGKLWYFGFESWASLGSKEGERTLDRTRAPLYPYINAMGGIEVCPSFPYNSAMWKPKFKGASYGYGFNTFLSNTKITTVDRPSQVALFADCAQVNNFQAPASRKNPMLEEFYMLDNWYQTTHFRHGQVAQCVFLDGHVEGLQIAPQTQDLRLPSANVGRFSPYGSMLYLQ